MADGRLSVESVLGTIFDDEVSLDESSDNDGDDAYGYLGASVLHRSDIESESRLLAGSDMDAEYNEDGDEHHVWSDENAAVTNNSDSSQYHSKTGTRINSLSSDRDETVQDDVVSEIICNEISDKYMITNTK